MPTQTEKKTIRAPNKLVTLLLLLPILALCGWCQGRQMAFDRDCKGHLKRAGDANSIDLASKELRAALDYLEAHGMTEGYAAVFYNTPANDMGFWYGNLKQAWTDLKGLPAEATELERSNMLLKLRETLLDHDKDGESVTAPSAAGLYPYIRMFAVLVVIAGFLGIFGAVGFVRSYIRFDKHRLTIGQAAVGSVVLLLAFGIPVMLILFS